MKLNFTYQQKLKLLPILFAGTLICVYFLAISQTIMLRKKCNNLKEQVVAADFAPTRLKSLQIRLNEINKMNGNVDYIKGSDPLLSFVSLNTGLSIRLIEYYPLHIYLHQPYQVETRIAVFEGNYKNLLQLLFQIEKKYSSGKVVSVKFSSETNLKTSRKRLLMTLYIQSVVNITDNKDNNQYADI